MRVRISSDPTTELLRAHTLKRRSATGQSWYSSRSKKPSYCILAFVLDLNSSEILMRLDFYKVSLRLVVISMVVFERFTYVVPFPKSWLKND